ncbi:serine/threonine-protein phosphatase 5-like [Clavelina lepadiformis]|uniref:Serine/threonine-protein phosphatase n=1 Tax=Clavelina lepadiformis TaxID=159417 RepID=A0ABP0FDV4_CLALP
MEGMESAGTCVDPKQKIDNACPESEEDIKQKAEQFKEEANKHFKEKNYEDAVCLYTQAIGVYPKSAVYYANRSFAHLRLENYGYALEDATRAIENDRKYIKAYYRRASAYMSLGKFKPALRDFEAVVKVKPKDKDAKLKYTECSKIVKQKAFERAIACNEYDKKPIADSINLDTISVESTYDGPKIPDAGITADFMKELIETFKNQKKLHKRYAYQILLEVKKIFFNLPSLVDVTLQKEEKLTVCGDIHGQYYDLCNIFDLNQLPSKENPYLFNGDFVDRGSWSVEVILVLFGFKVLYPEHFHLVRGNHETDNMNQMYGFEGEVKQKYGGNMMEFFSEVFNWLPLAYCVNGKVLIMHGGLCEEDGITLNDLRSIDRNRQPPESGTMCDLLWSDPQMQQGRGRSKRGVSCQFGPDITSKFLQDNGLDYVIRSHEVKHEGYEEQHNGKLITIFSAPNYCDQMGNKGAFITLEAPHLKPKFTQFQAVKHPEIQPMAYANSVMRMPGMF